jgi:hypothetical protein
MRSRNGRGVALNSKNQRSQEDAEDQDDEEDDDRDEEQNLRDRPEVGGNSGETKEPRNERNEKEYDGPLDHEQPRLERRKNEGPSARGRPMLQSRSVVVRVYQ